MIAPSKLGNSAEGIHVELEKSLPEINDILQDIERVKLNLSNNAFYAVNEKHIKLNKDLTGFENLSGLEK